MISRFELFVIVRNQVRDKALVRRAVALEAVTAALARVVGADAELWGLTGLGADIDVRLTAGNPARRGHMAAELLLTEGLPSEGAAAVRARVDGAPDALPPLARALVVAEALAGAALADLDDAEAPVAWEELAAAHLAHRLAKAARRANPAAARALACVQALGLTLDAAAAAAVAGLAAAREDL